MLDVPEDITPEEIAWCVRHYWEIHPVETTYAALGHGSYNWIVRAVDGTRWFVKVDPMESADFCRVTYRTAALLHESGLDFVHSATRDRSGELRRALSPEWEISVFSFIEGRNPDFRGPERSLIAEAIGRLHAFPAQPDVAMRWTPGYRQAELHQLLANDLGRPWFAGPYGERARSLYDGQARHIKELQALHDRLRERLYASDELWVVTHGEPHGGNTMLDTEGNVHLIDCNASMIAPRERDLRLLLYVSHQRPRDVDNTEVIAAYERGSGRPVHPRPFVLELFRSEWHLMEISGLGEYFRDPHEDSEATAYRWRTLNKYLPVDQNWLSLQDTT